MNQNSVFQACCQISFPSPSVLFQTRFSKALTVCNIEKQVYTLLHFLQISKNPYCSLFVHFLKSYKEKKERKRQHSKDDFCLIFFYYFFYLKYKYAKYNATRLFLSALIHRSLVIRLKLTKKGLAFV